jgi:uncharacterized membrane protein YdjX (TVP38/TMEM64 family)
MTAVYVLLVGMTIAIVGSFLALTLVAYVGRALTRDRARRVDAWVPAARVVKR